MSGPPRDLLAAQYVLGVLDTDARARVEADMAGDAALRLAVDQWMQDLAGLEPAAAPAPPPALWEGIARRIAAPEPAGTRTEWLAGAAWQALAPGVSYSVLHEDRAAGVQSYLLRLEPGANLPAHSHRMDEECVVLEGELRIGALRVGPGDFHLARAGSEHPALRADVPTLVFLRGEARFPAAPPPPAG